MGNRSRERFAAPHARSELERLVGVHPVREALRARRRSLGRLILRAQARAPRPELLELVGLARERGVAVEEWDAVRFDDGLAPGVPHQGVMLEAGPLPSLDVAELAAIAQAAAHPWLVALDGIEDPQNLGAILRVGEAAGVQGAILPERRAAPLTPAVARASAGAVEHLPIASVTNLIPALEVLKRDHGFWVHAADPSGEHDLYQVPDRLLEGPLVLVLGAEGRGLRPGVRAAVDLFVRIPMSGRVASLNVASAAAVVLFEWSRRSQLRVQGRG